MGVLSPGVPESALLRRLSQAVAGGDADANPNRWSLRASNGFALCWRGQVQTIAPSADAATVPLAVLAGGLPIAHPQRTTGGSCDVLTQARSLANCYTGAFSVVAHDAQSGNVYLLRDRAGLQPLYVAHISQRKDCAPGIAFASQVRPLLALLGARRATLDHAGVAAHALEDWRYVTRTVYRDIHAVPPGCYLRLRPDVSHAGSGAPGEDCARWWPGPLVPSPVKRWADAVQQVRETVQLAVRDLTRSEAAVAIDVSGGVDSSSVFAGAQALKANGELGGTELFASSLSFPGLPCDESRYVDAVLARWPAPLFRSTAMALDETTLRRESLHTGLPPYALAGMHAALNRSLCEAGVSVRLSGEGGDELFALGAASALRLSWAARDGTFPQVACQVGMRVARHPIDALRTVLARLRSPAAPAWVESVRRQFSADGVAEMNRALAEPEAFSVPPVATGLATADAVLRRFSSGWYAQSMDGALRAHAAQGVELRCPLLDHRVLEVCATLPAAWMDGPQASNRALLRAAFAPLLPKVITARQDKSEFSYLLAPRRDQLAATPAVIQALQALNIGYRGVPASKLVGAAGLGAIELGLWRQASAAIYFDDWN